VSKLPNPLAVRKDRNFSFLRHWAICCCVIIATAAQATPATAARPNVLFISVDDLNDWIGVFGGHPQAQTPHIDAFARSGSVVFQKAHCAGPVCGPSRSALLSGFMPHRTGLYGNANNMLDSDMVQRHATLPEYFSKHGYRSISRGKIFHAHATANGKDRGHWAFDEYHPGGSGSPVDRTKVYSRDKNLIAGKPGPPSKHTKGGGSEFAWGPTRGGKEETRDYQTAEWAAARLQDEHTKPFFMAVGLSKPHLPFYVPQEYYDLYDPETTKANEIREDDLDDILTPEGRRKARPSPDYLWLKENDLIDTAARAYLAACSYADACLGVIFDGLKKSPHSQNTIVILWGDHGWHLGEKLRYRKASGWHESTRVPLIVRLPGMTERTDCERLVNLIDFYPTLIELCGLPEKPVLDGRSFVPLLEDPSRKWNNTTTTIFGSGNASIHDERWHYIRHRDGTEELYDLESDPMEWINRIQQLSSESATARKRLRDLYPTRFAPIVPTSAGNTKANKRGSKGLDTTIKARRVLVELK
jgi:arylsulfatase A-like enzyme